MDGSLTMQPTRWAILQMIKHSGRATVEELARHLEVTPMAVRLHLAVLERDGLIGHGTLRRGPGRPALVYTLSYRADDLFPRGYDLLADALLGGLRGSYGDEGVVQACQWAADQVLAAHHFRLAGKPFPERLAEAASLLRAQGHELVWEPAETGYLVKNYNCPYQRVAEKHREVCGFDRHLLQQLLDADLESSDTPLAGGVHCAHIVKPRF